MSDESLGLGGLPCWCAGGMRLLASSGSMMLSGIQDGEGSGTGEGLAFHKVYLRYIGIEYNCSICVSVKY